MSLSYWFAVGLLVLLGWITRVDFHFLVAGLLVALGGAIQLWSRYALRGLELRRSVIRRDPVVGDPIGMRIEVENPRPLPVPRLRIDDRVGTARMAYLLSIGPYQSVTFEETTFAAERGVLPTGPAVLRTADPFGFRVSRLAGTPAAVVLVRPRIASLAPRQGSIRSLDTGTGMQNDRQIEAASDLYGRRNRTWTLPGPGDALDRALARNGRIHILLDLVGEGVGTDRGGAANPPAAIETAISVTAAAAGRALDAGAPVALDSNGLAGGRRGRLRIGERTGAEQQQRIGVALARVRAGGRISLASLLRRAVPFGAEPADKPAVLVITVGGCPKARRYLRRLEKHGHDILVWSVGDATWFPGALRIDPIPAGADSGVSAVGEGALPAAGPGDRPTGSARLRNERRPDPVAELDRLVLVSARAVLRLCWVWPWLCFLSFASSPQRGPVVSFRALTALVIGSWLFGQWLRLGSRARGPDTASPASNERVRSPRKARWKPWLRVASAIAALLLCTWFFEFRSVVPFRDATWLHILGEDLMAGGGRSFWRAAGILAAVHVWMGTLFDTEERVDRGAIWSGFMITASFLVALAALLPLAGLPAESAPRQELLLALTAALVGLLRTGADLGRALDPRAVYVDSPQRKSLFSWALLGSQLRGRNGR